MMQVTDLLSVERIDCQSEAPSKKRALEKLSNLIASGQNGLSETEIFDSLISRERLGSTGLGHGVAIPHGRVKNAEQTIGAFIKLSQGIDFDAIDQQPVQLLFALLVPENSTDEHLQLLAQLAKMFSDDNLQQKLTAANDSREIFELIKQWETRH